MLQHFFGYYVIFHFVCFQRLLGIIKIETIRRRTNSYNILEIVVCRAENAQVDLLMRLNLADRHHFGAHTHAETDT